MKILSLCLVYLYAALNAFLAVVGPLAHRRAALTSLVPPCLLFVIAAALLAHGAWSRNTTGVVLGLLFASLAPIAFGALVEHSNVLLHHAVRAVVASLVAVLWSLAFHGVDQH